MNIKVIKASGESEVFSEEKVKNSLKRAGANPQLIEKILANLEPKLYEGISTKKIYEGVFSLLNKFQSPVSSRYNLKKAIMELGPSGYPFEKFVAGVLENYGYQTKTNQVLQGKCIDHEIDVLLSKNQEKFLVECKFHSRQGIKVDIKIALYVYARFIDVQAENQEINQVWLVTNTKVTSKVKKYANCLGIKIISWDYPQDFNLGTLIGKSHLHPITCLNSLSKGQKNILLENGVVFCSDLLKKKITFLQRSVLQKAKKEALSQKESIKEVSSFYKSARTYFTKNP